MSINKHFGILFSFFIFNIIICLEINDQIKYILVNQPTSINFTKYQFKHIIYFIPLFGHSLENLEFNFQCYYYQQIHLKHSGSKNNK